MHCNRSNANRRGPLRAISSSCLFAALLASGCGGDAVELGQGCAVAVGDSPTRGPENAWVTGIEFGDFQCPYCGSVEPTIGQIDQQRPGVVRWVFKHFPLSMHPRAVPAAIAAECARAQGLFWPMHDLLFQHQTALSDSDLLSYAKQSGADVPAWQACLETDAPRQRIALDKADAARANVNRTPQFFFNGIPVLGAQNLSVFLSVIERARTQALSSGLTAADYYAGLESRGCQ